MSTVSAIRRAQLCEPVLSTFCGWVLALLTVAVKLAPCISDFIIVGNDLVRGVRGGPVLRVQRGDMGDRRRLGEPGNDLAPAVGAALELGGERREEALPRP